MPEVTQSSEYVLYAQMVCLKPSCIVVYVFWGVGWEGELKHWVPISRNGVKMRVQVTSVGLQDFIGKIRSHHLPTIKYFHKWYVSRIYLWIELFMAFFAVDTIETYGVQNKQKCVKMRIRVTRVGSDIPIFPYGVLLREKYQHWVEIIRNTVKMTVRVTSVVLLNSMSRCLERCCSVLSMSPRCVSMFRAVACTNLN